MSASVSPAISEYLLYIYTQKRNKNIKKNLLTVHGASTMTVPGCFQVATGKDCK